MIHGIGIFFSINRWVRGYTNLPHAGSRLSSFFASADPGATIRKSSNSKRSAPNILPGQFRRWVRRPAKAGDDRVKVWALADKVMVLGGLSEPSQM